MRVSLSHLLPQGQIKEEKYSLVSWTLEVGWLLPDQRLWDKLDCTLPTKVHSQMPSWLPMLLAR